MQNETALLYNVLDAACTLEIWEAQEELLKDPKWRLPYDLTMSLYKPLTHFMNRGIQVNLEALQETKKEVEQKITEVQNKLDEIAGYHLNPNSSKACQDYFYKQKGLKPYLNKGRPTTDDLAMARLARQGFREASLIQEIRGLLKLKGTYLEMLFDEDNRVRCSYNIRGTLTGRLSSSQTIFGTGGNFQNIPPQMKKFLVADPGMIMVEADKARAEWVVVAYAANDPAMLKVIEEDLDPHASTASLMFSAPFDLILEEDALIGHTTDPLEIEEKRKKLPALKQLSFLPRTMSLRQSGKRCNHSLNYGLGFRNFALRNEIAEIEAKRIIASYEKAYPNVPLWRQGIEHQIRSTKSLSNCYGRTIRFYSEISPELYRQAYAFIPQSTVSDMLNLGIAALYENEEKNPLISSMDMLAQVHDSLLYQVPEESLKTSEQEAEHKKLIDRYLSPPAQYNQKIFKIKTDFKKGLTWGSLKSF